MDESIRSDSLFARVRGWVQEALNGLLTAEIEHAVQAGRYQRGPHGRRGYRHAGRARVVTTSVGPVTVRVPRARLFDASGTATHEWQNAVLPRYARRTREVDETVLGAYLAGANTRRIRGALMPLLGGGPLSRSAISRVMRTLRESFEAWRTRSLHAEGIVYLLLDAITVRVRVDRRVQRQPVLVALGVDASGDKRLLAVQLMGHESTVAWRTFVEDLVGRGLRAPVLIIIDGHAGLRRAVSELWPQAAVQRCVVHKLRNLEAHAPKRSLDELRADFHAITTAADGRAGRAAYGRFIRRWQMRAEGVARSLEEAGDELLTFYQFPRSQWKSLRTTNAIERVHEEFRRRIKTQASQPHEQSVLRLFFALYQSGQIKMRKIDGWVDLPQVLQAHRIVA
jgi:transposase-like protein